MSMFAVLRSSYSVRFKLETIWLSSISKAKLAGPDKFSRQSKIFLIQAKKEQGIQSPKRPLCLLGSRKRTPKSRVISPFAIATPRCQQNFRYFSPPRRAEGSRRQRLPIAVPVCFSASCRLPLHPFPSRRRRESTRHLPGPQPHTTSETPKPPSTEANHISASVEFAQSSSLEWRSIRAWVDFVFWWLESLLLAEDCSVVNQRFC